MESPTGNGLTPDTKLHRASGMHVYVGSANEVRVEVAGGSSVACGSRALAVLDAFRSPTTMGDALDELRTRITGSEEFMTVSATILLLVEHGLLLTDDDRALRATAAEEGWANPSVHVGMLNDRARTEAYIGAIKRAVRPDDVVLDLGTGTGVLAVAAARAGARHVYAVEASGIARVAAEVFRANGVDDRITLLEGWSSSLTLPEPATLMVSEIIGHDPLDEGVLENTLDARARLLTADARMIPRRLGIGAYGFRMPPEDEARSTPSSATISAWHDWYGIDLGALGTLRQGLPFLTTVRPERAAEWEAVTEPVVLSSIDLGTFDELAFTLEVSARAVSDGPLHGVLLYSEIELDDVATVSTRPPGPVHARTSWRNVVWLLPEPFEVRARSTVDIVYRYRAAGEPTLEISA